MSFCSSLTGWTTHSVGLTSDSVFNARLFVVCTQGFSTFVFVLLLLRLRREYTLTLRNAAEKFKNEGSRSQLPLASSSFAYGFSASVDNNNQNSAQPSSPSLPLVFPIFFRYLFLLLIILLTQLCLSFFHPSNPINGIKLFVASMTIFTFAHMYELGLLVFLCQRSIGLGAIRRSFIYACIWGALVLTVILIGAFADGNMDTPPTPEPSSYSPSYYDCSGIPCDGITPIPPSTARNNTNMLVLDSIYIVGSTVLPMESTFSLYYTFWACFACDVALVIYYALLCSSRIRCLKIAQWLNSRDAAFALARYLLIKRLLSSFAMFTYLIWTSEDAAYCLSAISQLFLMTYGFVLYIVAAWDSRFWRSLEYLANGPYPAYRSLDQGLSNLSLKPPKRSSLSEQSQSSVMPRNLKDSGEGNIALLGRLGRLLTFRTNPPAPTTPSTSSPAISTRRTAVTFFNDDDNAQLIRVDSIAPLLKLPRTGLTNLESVHRFLVDFAELDIHTEEQIGVGQDGTAVYAAFYRGRPVAVKRIRCDTLTIDLIESQLSEARLLSQCNHPHIVKLIGVCIRPPAICLVSELCPRGSLFNFIRIRQSELSRRQALHDQAMLVREQINNGQYYQSSIPRNRNSGSADVPYHAFHLASSLHSDFSPSKYDQQYLSEKSKPTHRLWKYIRTHRKHISRLSPTTVVGESLASPRRFSPSSNLLFSNSNQPDLLASEQVSGNPWDLSPSPEEEHPLDSEEFEDLEDAFPTSLDDANSQSLDPFNLFPLPMIFRFALHASLSVAYLHSHNPPIIHRDIKSSNFVISADYQLKLIDFGESTRLDKSNKLHPTDRGTLGWMAPELFSKLPIPWLVRHVLGIHQNSISSTKPTKTSISDTTLTDDDIRRLLVSAGVSATKAEGLEILVDFEDATGEEEEWEQIIQATLQYVSVQISEQQKSTVDIDTQSVASSVSETTSNNPSVLNNPSSSPSFHALASAPSMLSSFSLPMSSPSLSRLAAERGWNSSLNIFPTGSPTAPTSSSFSFIPRSLWTISSNLSEKVDVYAIGMVIWAMCSLTTNPFATIPSSLIPFLVSHRVRPKIHPQTPPLLAKLIRACWQQNPAYRPTAQQIVDRLECIQYQLCGITPTATNFRM